MYSADRDNPWIRDVLDARRRWRGWAAVAATGVFSVTVLQTFAAVGPDVVVDLGAAFGRYPPPWPDLLASGALQALIFGLFLLAAFVGCAFEERRPWRHAGGSLEWIAGGVIIGVLGFCAAAGLAAWKGAIVPGLPPSSPPAIPPLAFGAAIVAVQALAEEAFFRGWLQPILCAAWTVRPGVVATAVLFAALHVIAGVQGPLNGSGGLAVANLFLGGLLFGLLAIRSGNLFAPAAAHFAWNWTESGVMGLNHDPSGSVLSLAFAGAPMWNGGPDTMNGSVATTIVLMALVAFFAVVGPRRAPEARVSPA
jgi:uncharacterized protein